MHYFCSYHAPLLVALFLSSISPLNFHFNSIIATTLHLFLCFTSFSLSAWSLNQPNTCPARAMYGVDVILSDNNTPLTLEVQWAPDCSQAVIQNKCFWDEILGGLYRDDFTKFHKLWYIALLDFRSLLQLISHSFLRIPLYKTPQWSKEN